MKNKIILLVICALIGLSTSLRAQNHLKIGYTDPNYILELMPESKQIQVELAAYNKQLEGQLQSKYAEYQAKLDAYQKGANTMPELVRQDKEKELMAMQNSIKEFQEKADEDLQRKNMSLLDPVYTKIKKAIEAVAEEHGYTYIFNNTGGEGQGVILYSKNKTENISDLVLKKLGVTPPVPGATTPNTTAPLNNKK